MSLTRRKLPLNALRAFETAAKHCHLRNAADELGVTHGAISRHISQLEESFDIKLFDRSHNRLTLTASGRRLYEGLQKGFDQIMESTLLLQRESIQGELVIASTTSISSSWLVCLIGQFHRRYPDIDLRLKTISPFQDEISADIDIAICFGQPNVQGRDVKKLYREQYLPVASAARFSKQDGSVEAILQQPLLYDRHHHWARWLLQYAPQGEVSRKLFFEDSAHMVVAAKEGLGIALCDPLEIQNEIKQQQLLPLCGLLIDSEQDYFLVCHPYEQLQIRAQLFVDFIQHFFNEKEFNYYLGSDTAVHPE